MTYPGTTHKNAGIAMILGMIAASATHLSDPIPILMHNVHSVIHWKVGILRKSITSDQITGIALPAILRNNPSSITVLSAQPAIPMMIGAR